MSIHDTTCLFYCFLMIWWVDGDVQIDYQKMYWWFTKVLVFTNEWFLIGVNLRSSIN